VAGRGFGILERAVDRRGEPGRRVGRRLFHVHTRHGFFNLSTWLTAIADAAVLLLVSS
jgi:uncharacterized membrane protein YsdA (DUF1294 family)